MKDSGLRDCRILVAEDEFVIADEFCTELEDAGAMVIGPVATVEHLLRLIASSTKLNGAVLDINLCGEMSFQAADQLMKAGVPFIFATGHDVSSIPDRFEHIIRCEKPVVISRVAQTLRQAMGI